MFPPSPFRSPGRPPVVPDFGKNLSPIKWAEESGAGIAFTPPRPTASSPTKPAPSPSRSPVRGSPAGVTSPVPTPPLLASTPGRKGGGTRPVQAWTSGAGKSRDLPSPPPLLRSSPSLRVAPSASVAAASVGYGQAQRAAVAAVRARAQAAVAFDGVSHSPGRRAGAPCADACVQTDAYLSFEEPRGDGLFEYDPDTGRRLGTEERVLRIRQWLRVHPPPPLQYSYR